MYGAPKILGTDDVVLKVGDRFNHLNKVTAEDSFGVSLTTITVEGLNNLKLDTPGEYKLIYKVTDAAGNETIEERIVKVYGAPIIFGISEVSIKVGDTFNELDQVIAEDSFGVDLTQSITVEGLDKLDLNNPGEYKLTYKVTDVIGNETIEERTVKVYGAPIIFRTSEVSIKVGDTFNELDQVIAEDSFGVDLTQSITVEGLDQLDLNTPGEYKLTYKVTDVAGNEATAERIVKVYGAPTIIGTDDVVIKVGDQFNELDKVIAEDSFGVDLTQSITVEGLDQLDLNTPGEYKLTYKVTDAVGNETIEERIVTVTAISIETSNPENNNSIDKDELVQDIDKEINSNNPSTGDSGVFRYMVIAMAAAIGLAKNTKKKKDN